MPRSYLATIRTIFGVIVIFLLAIAFRLWFITLAPQPFIYDQIEYEMYAQKIFNRPFMLASHTYRAYPLPFLMAALYKIVGWANHPALYTVNAMLDSLVAVMVYVLLKDGFQMRKIAWFGYILYAFNPFTSGYVGTGLSEILATFFVTATLLVGMYYIRRPSIGLGLGFGLCAGMAAETRSAAFMWAALPIALTILWINWKKHLPGYISIFLGLLLTVLYPLYTNWRDYREFNITKVDSFYAMEFFNGVTLKTLPPFTKVYPSEQFVMWGEYWSEYHPGRTKAERSAIADKYFKKGWDILVADPMDYIRWRFYKMWYVWQKENIFFYIEPGYESHRKYVYMGNLILLIFGIIGILRGYWLASNMHGKWIWASLVGTIVYGTIAFCFSHAEYRLTIPFYSAVIALASVGVASIASLVKRRTVID